MAEIAEVVRLPPIITDDEEIPGCLAFPASPLEYFSKTLAVRICDQWREVDDPMFNGSFHWLLGVRSALHALETDSGFSDGRLLWVRPAIDDIDTLIFVAHKRRWNLES